MNIQLKNPDELLKFMSTIKYDLTTKDENYIIKKPQLIIQNKKGICYDQVELERDFFKKWHYQFKTYFIYEKLPLIDNQTHTFLIFKEKNKYYWFENSWEAYKEIHGPFISYMLGVNYVSSMFKKTNKWKQVNIIEYQKFNYTNMNIIKFADYIFNNFNKEKII